jgi:ABC-type antimicrobial peptide transport system permease subunit
MLLKELVSNVFRHPIRFFILSVSLGISTICVLFVFTILRTNDLNSQSSLQKGTALLELALKNEQANFVLPKIKSLTGLDPIEIHVSKVRGFKGISLKAYGFKSIDSLRKYRTDLSLLSGNWAKVNEALVTPEVCDLTKCQIGKMVNVASGSKDGKNFLISGIVQSSTPTTILTVDTSANTDLLTYYFLLKNYQGNVDTLTVNVVNELIQKKVEIDQDFTHVSDTQSQKSDFKILNYAFIVLIAPLAGVALFSAGLLVVFNFVVNRLERAKETAIKRALGASKFQIVTESLTEAIIVFSFTAIPALFLGLLSLETLNRAFGQGKGQTLFFPQWQLSFSASMVVLVLVLFAAFLPILGMVRETPSARLKEE